MGKLDGKVAFITGAARGQGRSHAIALAAEGADIIAVDICRDIETLAYEMATPDDLAQTVKEVEALDRRIVAHRADVRDLDAVQAALADGVERLGGVDIVLANAGVFGLPIDKPDAQVFQDIMDINLVGVWNTVHVALPIMVEQGRGGAIVITSSTAGLKGNGGFHPGGEAYAAAKHGVVGLMRNFATCYAPNGIRVNTVHPTGVATKMVMNDAMADFLQNDPSVTGSAQNLMPVEVIEASDVSRAIVWLVSDDARYVTGVTLPVDAGFNLK